MRCIVNAAYGSWYPKGQERMIKTVREYGYTGDIITDYHNEHFDPKSPYTVKAAAMVNAMRKGYTTLLWLDCSVFALKNIDPLFELIEKESVYFWRSGWNLAQSAADSDLAYAGWTRDEAELLYECASGMVGVNLLDQRVRRLMDIFIDANSKGVCSTSRHHDNQSKDPRFKFARQDQTALTIAYHKVGFTNEQMYESRVYSAYWDHDINDKVLLAMKGM